MYRLWLTFRSLVFWIWQIFSTLFMGAPVLLACLFSYKWGYPLAVMWNRMNVYGLRLICGVTWRLEGQENIPDKPCIVMCKHQSTWETYFLPTMFSPAVYVAKRSLRWIPIFGWTLVLLRFILIDRTSGRSAIQQMTEQAANRLSLGRWVLIFPEGTRSAVGSEPNYRIGGAIVAEKTGADVLPIAMNAGEFWPRMGFIKWPGEITVTIGPVISSAGKNSAQILAETEQWIEGRMAEITVTDRFPYKH